MEVRERATALGRIFAFLTRRFSKRGALKYEKVDYLQVLIFRSNFSFPY